MGIFCCAPNGSANASPVHTLPALNLICSDRDFSKKTQHLLMQGVYQLDGICFHFFKKL